MRLVNAALIDQVLDETTDRVVSERRDDSRIEAEAALQTARDVVLASALPHAETSRRVYARVAGVEPQHHLAERDDVPTALRLRFDR